MTRIATEKTPITSPEAVGWIREAMRIELGGEPSNKAVALLWALHALETARGRSMYNHNFGNLIGAGSANEFWGGDTIALKTRAGEVIFRGYDDNRRGSRDYVHLFRMGRYSAVWAQLASESPDFDAWFRAMSKSGYWGHGYVDGGAETEPTRRNLLALSREIEPTIESAPRPKSEPPKGGPSGTIAPIVIAIGALLSKWAGLW